MISVGIVSRNGQAALWQKVLGKVMGQRGRRMHLVTYTGSDDFVADWRGRGKAFDMVFLDLSFLPQRVLEVAKDLRAFAPETEIVFFAPDASHAVDAFRLDARHYIILPAGETEIMEGANRCLAALEANWHRAMVCRTQEGWQQVAPKEMESIISDDHCQTLQMTDGRLLRIRGKLKDLAERLEDISPIRFISPSRGTLVNAEEIYALEGNLLIMKSGRTVPISKRRAAEMKRCLES